MAFSIQRAVSDGTLQDLGITIQYINRADMQVFIEDVPQVEGTDYTWTNDTLIHFTVPVPNGDEVVIRRRTQLSQMLNIFALGAQFNNATMDENFEQVLFIGQEAFEGATITEVFNDIDMHGFRVRNLGDGSLPGDAVTYGQMQAFDQSALNSASAAAASAAAAAATAAAMDAKLLEDTSILDFMSTAQKNDAKLEFPTIDLSAVMQAAVDALTGTGNFAVTRSQVVNFPGGYNYLMDAAVTVRNGVQFRGEYDMVTDFGNGFHFTKPSRVSMGASGKFILQEGSGLKGLYMLRSNVTGAQTAAQVAAWTGTAVDATQTNGNIENCAILGFALGVNATNSRFRMRDVMVDCRSCILMDNSFDVNYLERVHCWPYLSTPTGNTADYIRSGSAFKLQNVADWAKLTDCFAYGWFRNYHLSGVGAVTLQGCGSDYTPGLANGAAGFFFEGTWGEISMDECQSAATALGIYVTGQHGSSIARGLYISNHKSWTNTTRCVQIDGAVHVQIDGGKFRGAPHGITINNVSAYGRIEGVIFSAITGDCIQHVVSGNNWRRRSNVMYDSPTGRLETLGKTTPNVTLTDPCPLVQEQDFVTLVGTGITINNFETTTAEVGRRYSVRFQSGGNTIVHAGSNGIRLLGAANLTPAANSVLHFVYQGNNVWQQA